MKRARLGESPLASTHLKGVSCQVKLWGYKGTLGVILEKKRKGILISPFGEGRTPPPRAQTLGASWDSQAEDVSPRACLFVQADAPKEGCKCLRQ